MFADRSDAGRQLAARLLLHYSRPDPLVLALPRGGLPVAAEVAHSLGADLDVLVVRKLGVPGNPEFAMGAIGEDGVRILDTALVRQLRVTDDQIDHAAADEAREVARRVQRYRGARERLVVAHRNVLIVDDGLATGSTAAAAVAVARRLGAAHVTVAVPLGSVQATEWLRTVADDVVCLEQPEPLHAVSQHYAAFPQLSDEDVVLLIAAHPHRHEPLAAHEDRVNDDVVIESAGVRLNGHIRIPASAKGVVLFAHGSGSSRFSPRNVAVANALNGAGLGTLLFDLLTDHEADVRNNVFDIELLADRLSLVTDWVLEQPYAEDRKLGYFGASTGAAAALVANAKKPDVVSAIVSRGGRPDLAGGWLAHVSAPTLLIVGSHDKHVMDLNREAQRRLHCPNLIEVVRGATHLFEEPGALCQVSRLAQSWFLQYLC
ncbi:MAG: phosphoribosyltransferase [Actinomycetes bacterium]